jgi:hypothetical protein
MFYMLVSYMIFTQIFSHSLFFLFKNCLGIVVRSKEVFDFVLFSFQSFFFSAGDQTQGLTYDRQLLHQLS